MLIILILFINIFTNSDALFFGSDRKFTYNVTLPVPVMKLLGYPRDNYLYFTQKAEEQGFQAFQYTVQTEDGYLLKLFEVRSPKCRQYRKPPVLMVHGIFFNADIFLVAGPDSALAYLLARDCYDVFVGNVRGTDHGRRHVFLNPNTDPKFWDFSLTEFGKYDLTGMIDFVLAKTNSEKLNYIGYSQGASVYMIALSTRPENNDKIDRAVLLAPALNLHYTRSLGFKIIFDTVSFLRALFRFLGIYEILFKGSLIQVFLQFLCHNATFTMPICTGILSVFDAYYPGSILPTTLENFVAIFPVGVSTKLIYHYQQLRGPNTFVEFDYGPQENMVRYGSVYPPKFDTCQIRVPTVLVGGQGDQIVTLDEVRHINDLINESKMVVLDDPRWNHVDEVLNPRIANNSYPVIRNYFGDSIFNGF